MPTTIFSTENAHYNDDVIMIVIMMAKYSCLPISVV